MSLKRTYSTATTQEDFTQSQYEMPSKSQRRRSNSYSKNPFRSMVSRKSRVPRAIRSRGTPDGYYEIPVTVYRRIYFNMTSGLWETNPYTAVTSGVTGYQGFGMGTQLDTSQCLLGNGAVSAAIQVTVPGFAQLAAVFDECKIVKIDYEFWVAAQSNEIHGSLFQAPNIWVALDTNGFDPPGNLDTLLQYSTVKCIKGDINHSQKITVYPKIREDVSTDGAETSTAASSSAVRSSTYMSTAKPAAVHYGLRGWFEVNNAAATTSVGYLCIKETQLRRYKVNK